jgi:hypothetical protein
MTAEFIQYLQRLKAFRLYIGFQKLGEFDTYAEARQYAGETSLSGVFNILGEKATVTHGMYQNRG